MAKKFMPTSEQLELILTRYKETNNYSLISRETGLSVAIIKRIITENIGDGSVGKNQYTYIGLPPQETELPSKIMFYHQITKMREEFLNVCN